MQEAAPRDSRRDGEAPSHKNQRPWQLECKSSIKILILHNVFEGKITKYCRLQCKMLRGSHGRSAGAAKAHNATLLQPLQINLFGETCTNMQTAHQSGCWKNGFSADSLEYLYFISELKPISNIAYQIQCLTIFLILDLQENIYKKFRKPTTCRPASPANMQWILGT